MYVIIVGCGRVGSELAKLLSTEGHNVVVIDRHPKSFERLGRTFNGVTLEGNGFDVEILKQAGIAQADAFCSVTNGDNSNIVAAQVAKKIFKVPKVIARVYDPARADIYRSLGLDVISGTILFAAMLRDKIIESRFSSYLIESKDVGVLEIEVGKDLVGKNAEEINIPGELMVVMIKSVKGVSLPLPKTKLQKDDVVMALVKIESLDKVRKRFGL
ncbi:TrkA family potassium uptake protein [bacterium]|nr:MAG: TrkA family potassium uptake protein [bacterium]